MKDLIEALTIFSKYTETEWPTNCEHDELFIMDVSRLDLTEEEHARVLDLGFMWDEDDEVYSSFRFGSA